MLAIIQHPINESRQNLNLTSYKINKKIKNMKIGGLKNGM